jgi:hypothetical protein
MTDPSDSISATSTSSLNALELEEFLDGDG